MTEPYGTTPLPLPVDATPICVKFDPSVVASQAQQPLQQEMANFRAQPHALSVNGASVIAVNAHFLVYSVKNGLLRVLHRNSVLKTLLRGHQDSVVSDVQFFHDGDMLTTAGGNSTESKVIIWRIFERSPDIASDILLEIKSPNIQMKRILWHPFNPNNFFMLHTNESGVMVATLVETTRITTTADPVHGHPVADFASESVLQEGGLVIQHEANLQDLAWSSRDTCYAVGAYDNGDIILWDVKATTLKSEGGSTIALPVALQKVTDEKSVTRCMFLPHEQIVPLHGRGKETCTTCFVTGSDKNRVLTLWSACGRDTAPSKLQVVQIDQPDETFSLAISFGPAPATADAPSSFITACSQEKGTIYAFHCKAVWSDNKKALLAGSDYVVPFQTKYPIYSFTLICAPTADISEEELSEQGGLIFDMKVFAHQQDAVRCLTLTSYMCLPPESTYVEPTPGVSVEILGSAFPSCATRLSGDEFEDYDIPNDDDDDSDAATETISSIPNAAALKNNPFSNWLGTIAAKTTGAAVSSAPAPPALMSPPTGVITLSPASSGSPNLAFLSPIESDANADIKTYRHEAIPNESLGKQKKTKTKERANISLLKREGTPPVPPIPSSLPTPSVPPSAAPSGVSSGVTLEEVRRVVREEMSLTIIPAIDHAVANAVKGTIAPLQQSVVAATKREVTVDNSRVAKDVAENVKGPLRAAFVDNMKTVFIPALESVSGQVLQRVSLQMQNHNFGQNNDKMDAISKQLSTITALVSELTKEVHTLRTAVATKAAPSTASLPLPHAPTTNPIASAKALIQTHLNKHDYENAFKAALATSSTEIIVFCCTKANLQNVFSDTKPGLSQLVLLCLMQQLAAVLANTNNPDVKLELDWLQEIALTLNPSDPSIQKHFPEVLLQVTTSINQRMKQTENVTVRRSLQRMLQVVRGMNI